MGSRGDLAPNNPLELAKSLHRYTLSNQSNESSFTNFYIPPVFCFIFRRNAVLHSKLHTSTWSALWQICEVEIEIVLLATTLFVTSYLQSSEALILDPLLPLRSIPSGKVSSVWELLALKSAKNETKMRSHPLTASTSCIWRPAEKEINTQQLAICRR